MLLRFILNKSPKSIKCLLWALVAIRLVCPFSIESKFSLAPDAEVVSMDNYVGMPNVLSKTTGSDRYVKGYAESYDHEVVTVEKKNTDPLHIFSIIWLRFGKLLEDMQKSETVYTYNGKHIYL